MKKTLILITGGARSGKSRLALEMAKKTGDKVAYIAPAIAFDDEMKHRIKKHKAERPSSWTTFETYKNLDEIVKKGRGTFDTILLDCLTIVTSNLLILDRDIDWDKIDSNQVDEIREEIETELNSFLNEANSFKGNIIIVTNELGMGLVPPYPLGRIFRDIAGNINQLFARKADEVYFTVSGIPLKIKGK